MKLGAEDFVLSADEGVLARAASDTRMRTMLAAIAAGVIDQAMREAVSYGKDRRQFGKPISDFEAMREKIADIASHSVTARCATGSCSRRRSS